MDRSPPWVGWIALASATVFTIAVALRVPSCYESFWVDELHTGWTVWADLGEVLRRADLGHQSPFYFVGLWFWKQMVGDSELALRMSSVLAVAASSVVLTVGIALWSRSLLAGVVAGLVVATESNSLFFGTELRPYAMVILFASIALICFLRLVAVGSRHEDRRGWIGITAAILLAVLCQPTAIGILAWLPLTLIVVWLVRDHRKMLKFNLTDGFIILGAAAVGFALWRASLSETWHQRNNWTSFATATRVAEIWEVWDWNWLLVTPLGVLFAAAGIAKLRGRSTRGMFVTTMTLSLIAVLGTGLYWLLSWANIIPVWHRRYFIAVIPVLACVAGGAVGVMETALLPHRKSGFLAVIIAVSLALALPYQQGTLERLRGYPVALVIRGEDWRSAVDWVRSKARPNDLVFVDAGLIETKAWLPPSLGVVTNPASAPASEQLEYLAYAVSGPYDLGRKAVPIDAGKLQPPWLAVGSIQSQSRRIFIIVRIPARAVNASLPAGSHVVGFGNVSVVIQSSKLDQRF